jgi:hypothetical protein
MQCMVTSSTSFHAAAIHLLESDPGLPITPATDTNTVISLFDAKLMINVHDVVQAGAPTCFSTLQSATRVKIADIGVARTE